MTNKYAISRHCTFSKVRFRGILRFSKLAFEELCGLRVDFRFFVFFVFSRFSFGEVFVLGDNEALLFSIRRRIKYIYMNFRACLAFYFVA